VNRVFRHQFATFSTTWLSVYITTTVDFALWNEYHSYMEHPFDPNDAKERIRELLSQGRIFYSRPHALERLRERNITMVDCENVLRGGSVGEGYKEGGNWRYKVSTNNMEVVVQFLPYNQLMIITAWRKGGKP